MAVTIASLADEKTAVESKYKNLKQKFKYLVYVRLVYFSC